MKRLPSKELRLGRSYQRTHSRKPQEGLGGSRCQVWLSFCRVPTGQSLEIKDRTLQYNSMFLPG